ncbi:MAG: hypothetical protein GY771_05320 [bacterium]|nr:hypothetical protein [bacterium]
MPPNETDTLKIVGMSYAEFREKFDWKQGEHIALIGPTESGKTTLGLDLLDIRDYVTVIGTKPKDNTLSDFATKKRYRIIPEFPKYFDPENGKRLVLWPKMKQFKDITLQRHAVGHGLQSMFVQKNWCIFVDEAYYISDKLKLKEHLEIIWTQGRSLGLSLVAGTQRPAYVPLLMYDQSTHLFFWRDNDRRNLDRISGIGYLNSDEIREAVARLPKHFFLYVNTRTGEMIVSKVTQQRKGTK